jgi:hypothetical protein
MCATDSSGVKIRYGPACARSSATVVAADFVTEVFASPIHAA